METRPFGCTGLVVSEVGLGCAGIGSTFGAGTDHVRLLREALDAGITFFDTSDLYGQGASEITVGRAFQRRRDEVVIATKGGYVAPGRRRALARVKPLVKPVVRVLRLRRAVVPHGLSGQLAQDFSPAHIRGALEASLRRLGTDHVDVYQLHSPDRSTIEAAEYLGVLHELRDAGKVRAVGIAADHPDDLDAVASGAIAVDAIQAPYSLLHPEAADSPFPGAAERGIGIVSRSCFAAGLLAPHRTADELRAGTERWEHVLRLRAAAEQLGRPLLDVALQFSLRAPASTTILGMSHADHLRANLTLLDAPRMTEEEISLLCAAAQQQVPRPAPGAGPGAGHPSRSPARP